jgi:hypothetical protein
LNYALGYTAVAVAGTPTGVTYTFYMTSWSPASIATVYNDTLVTTQFNSVSPAVAASITMQLQTTSTATPGSGAVVNITGTTSFGNSSGAAYVTGILVNGGITVAGGLGYTVGSTYLVSQGTNITGAIQVTSIGTGGSITGFQLVNSYTFQDTGASLTSPDISVPGSNYTDGSATLVYAALSNVQLNISGPGGSNNYIVPYNGAGSIVPSTAIGTGLLLIISIQTSSGSVQLITPHSNTWDGHSTGSVYQAFLPSQVGLSGSQGVNYSVGDIYELQMLSTNPSDPTVYATGALIMITDIGAGGSVQGLQLISTGTTESGYYPSCPFVPGPPYVIMTAPAPVATLTSSVEYILDTLESEINGTASAPYNVSDPNVTASVDLSSGSLELTALTPGSIGNSITVQDLSQITGGSIYYYYFPERTPTNLTGGNDGLNSGTILSTTLPTQASIATVGGVLYIANIGPFIIKYAHPGVLVLSSTYQGVQVLRKFAGSLIGLGLIPAPGTVVAATSMIITWSATDDLDVWNVLDLSGNVTGAGFAQLADIGDYLSGLIVTGGTAFILRSQGISYATATGNATNPYSFNHLGLGDEGEGAQLAQLSCQYDQLGAFVGNSDIYQISNSITPIGSKIKQLLFQSVLNNSLKFYGSASCSIYLGDEFPAILFVVGDTVFIFNAPNTTWQTLTIDAVLNAASYISAGVFATLNASLLAGVQNQADAIIALGQSNVYKFYSVYDGVAAATSLNVNSTVSFAVEEVSFARDITIDAIYISLTATLSANVTAVFNINGVFFSQLVLTPDVMNTDSIVPIGFQVFPASGLPFTAPSPQLQITITGISSTIPSEVAIIKVAMFGSYDPNQRPV